MISLLPLLGAPILSACLGLAVPELPTQGASTPEAPAIAAGRYLEARTASVFAGACHFQGEFDLRGREAVLAWSFREGSFQGQSLAGLSAVAVLSAKQNLSLKDSARRSVLFLPADLSAERRQALEALLRREYAAQLGTLVAVEAVPIELRIDERKAEAGKAGEEAPLIYALSIPERVELEGSTLADRACCEMPLNVWYEPFAAIEGALVGCNAVFGYSGAHLGPVWREVGDNSAFLGAFTIH